MGGACLEKLSALADRVITEQRKGQLAYRLSLGFFDLLCGLIGSLCHL
jgi:hypothetical protein